jgi:hypothetical protein
MERREEMRRLLGRRERQGLTFVELSRQTGIPVGTLASWAWKLRRGGRGRRAPTPNGEARGFVEFVAGPEIGCDRAPADYAFEVALANGRRIVVREGFDEEHFVRLVQTLERC